MTDCIEPFTSFVIAGRPAQMGSKVVARFKDKAWLRDANPKSKVRWENAAKEAGRVAMDGRPVLRCAVSLRVRFYFLRPKSHYGTGRNQGKLRGSAPERHTNMPDLDKLVRLIGDSLKGVIWADDCQIDRLHASRHWTEEQERAEVEVVL